MGRLLEETETAVAKDPDCHCSAQGRHCHNNLYKGDTWCTCKPQAAKTRRSIEEIRKELSSSLKPWSRPFCPTCSMTKETGVTAVDQMDEKQLGEKPQLDKARERTQCTGAAAGEEKHGTAVE